MAKKNKIEIPPEQLETLANQAAQETAGDAKEALDTVASGNSKQTNEKKKGKEEKPGKKKTSFRDFIDGSILTRDFMRSQLFFIFFLAALAMVYIWNKYHSERLARQMVTTQNELKEFRSEKISIQCELMAMSKQSEVVKMIEEKGLALYQLKDPPMKIVIGKTSKKDSTKVKK